MRIRHLADHRDLWIIAGRQMVAAERIEVAPCSAMNPLPMASPREIIRAILPPAACRRYQGAGQWLGPRGRHAGAHPGIFSDRLV